MFVCMCAREKQKGKMTQRELDRDTRRESVYMCVRGREGWRERARESERERDRKRERQKKRERER